MLLTGIIIGFLICMFAIPILEAVSELILSSLEIPKAAITKKILKENKVIQDLQIDLEPISTQCMGFHYNGDDEFYEDEIDDRLKK
jgi:hypothetical protein